MPGDGDGALRRIIDTFPLAVGQSRNSPEYRFIAIREPLKRLDLPGIGEQIVFPFPTMDFKNKGRYKVFGVVTNRAIPGDELIWWYRARCGKSEEAHSVMKEDLAREDLFCQNWWEAEIQGEKRIVIENPMNMRVYGKVSLPLKTQKNLCDLCVNPL